MNHQVSFDSSTLLLKSDEARREKSERLPPQQGTMVDVELFAEALLLEKANRFLMMVLPLEMRGEMFLNCRFGHGDAPRI